MIIDSKNIKESSLSRIPDILYEDDQILVVNKPAGMLSLADSTERKSLSAIVKEYLIKSQHEEKEVYCAPIHRLDRPVSGVMLFAKDNESAGRLSSDMKSGKIKKIYLAAVNITSDKPFIDEWKLLEQHYVRRRDRAYIVEPGVENSSLVSIRYRVIDGKGAYKQILVDLITGKRHQIRVQLSSLGMPIAGDRFYGSDESYSGGIICLHSLSLEFSHPKTGSIIKITAPVPDYILDKI